MYVKWSQDQYTRDNVSKRERKRKDTKILTTSLNKKNNTPINTMNQKTNSPLKSDYSHIQNYSPFLSRMTKGKSVK